MLISKDLHKQERLLYWKVWSFLELYLAKKEWTGFLDSLVIMPKWANAIKIYCDPLLSLSVDCSGLSFKTENCAPLFDVGA